MSVFLELVARHRRALLFFSWAVALFALLRRGRYLTFLRPEFGLVLGIAMVVLVLFCLSEIGRRDQAPHHWSLLLSPAILLVPLLFLLNAQTALLDSYAFERRSLGTPRVAAPKVSASGPVSSTPPVTPVPAPSPSPPAPRKKPPAVSHAVSVTHIDLYDTPEQYEGKMVSLVGMTYRSDSVRKDFGENALVLFRFVVTCCAADAQPISVVIKRKRDHSAFPDNTWVKVRGRFTIKSPQSDNVPIIEDAIVSATSEPQPPYLF